MAPHHHLLRAATFALLAGCAHGAAPLAAGARDTEVMVRCPMGVAGTWMSTADSTGGETLHFSTSGDAAALQSRVQAMADLHNVRHARVRSDQAGLPDEAPWARTRWEGAAMPPSYAVVEEVGGGAILEVTADAPDDIQQLRYALRVLAWRLQRDGCRLQLPPRGA